MTSADKVATPQEVAAAYQTTVGYVYKMASLHNWRKVSLGGRVHYHWDDAGKTLGK